MKERRRAAPGTALFRVVRFVAAESRSGTRLRARHGTANRKALRRTALRPSPVLASETSGGIGLTPQVNDLVLANARTATLEMLMRDHQAGVRAFLRALGV